MEERIDVVHSGLFAGLIAQYEQRIGFFLVFIIYLRYWNSGKIDVSVFGKALCCQMKNSFCNFMALKLKGLDLSFQKLNKHSTS